MIVDIGVGKLRGSVERGVHVFKGIPYASSTEGPRRFMPPLPMSPWTGVREAIEYGPACAQTGRPGFAANHLLASLRGVDPIGSMSEDCLVLNIWTPMPDAGNRPVLAYIHGGGSFGHAAEPRYWGHELSARGDVVVVTMNHRLGPLGHLYLGHLLGDEYVDSGIVGLLDIVAALRWIQEHIADFGGDPSNVTLFGESAGSTKVTLILGMPCAEGLFHRAVAQSGPGRRAMELPQAIDLTGRFLCELGLHERDAHMLHTLPIQQLLESSDRLEIPMDGVSKPVWGPVVAGSLPAHPFDPRAVSVATRVPLIIGTTLHEASLFLAALPGLSEMDDRTLARTLSRPSFLGGDWLGQSAFEAIEIFRRCHPAAPNGELAALIQTEFMRGNSISLAERRASVTGGAPTWMYLFAYRTTALGGTLGATHSLDVPFVFGHPDVSPLSSRCPPSRYRISELLSDTWASFSRSGNPNHSGLDPWPTYNSERRATMVFDDPCRVEDDPYSEQRQFWERAAPTDGRWRGWGGS